MGIAVLLDKKLERVFATGLIGRLGGEEFGAPAHGVDTGGAFAQADRF